MLKDVKANHVKKRICFIRVPVSLGIYRISSDRYKRIEKLQTLKKSKSTIRVTKRSVFGIINSVKLKENLTSVFETLSHVRILDQNIGTCLRKY